MWPRYFHSFYNPELSPDRDNFEVDSHQSSKWKYYTVVYPLEEVMGFQIPVQGKIKFTFTLGITKAAYQYKNELHQAMNTIDIFEFVETQYEQAE